MFLGLHIRRDRLQIKKKYPEINNLDPYDWNEIKHHLEQRLHLSLKPKIRGASIQGHPQQT